MRPPWWRTAVALLLFGGLAGTAAAAQFTNIDCIAVHD